MSVTLTDHQRQLIEQLGVYHESTGMAPVSGRVLSLLLVSPETELTFDEIRETLNISKSAASNAINFLLSTQKVEYITKPGDRKRYFRNLVLRWQEEISTGLKGMDKLVVLLNDVLKNRPGSTTEFNGKLKEIIDFLEFLSSKLDSIYAEWKERK